jgi:putative salt-induced outer membrane protein
MSSKHLAALFLAILATAFVAGADAVVLKNGDHLTGTIDVSDGKNLTLKTDFAGSIQIKWTSIAQVTTEKPLYVVTPDKRTVSGTLTTEGDALVVHTAAAGPVQVPMEHVTVVRSADAETAYEKSLHPSLIEGWKGGVNLGFALARGNSETTNLTTGFTADRKTSNDEITMYETSLYTSNDQPGGGVTANSIVGGVKFDRNVTKLVFGFVSADFTHDELQDLNVRQIYSGGLGLHLINTPTTTFDVLVGGNYTRETYSGMAMSVDRNIGGITTGENFMHKFGKSTTVTEVFYFYPDLSDTSQYRFSLDAASVTKINSWLGWQMAISDRYVTNPPIVGTKSNDVIFSTGLNVSFAH